MTDQSRDYRADPRAEFADRLEHDLLVRLQTDPDHLLPLEDSMTLDLLDEKPTTHRRKPWRLVAVGVVAAAAAVAIGAVLVARGGDDSGGTLDEPTTPGTPVSFEIAWPDLQGLEEPDCVPSEVIYTSAVDGHCFRRFAGEVDVSGAISGNAMWLMLGTLGQAADAADASVTIPAAFNGTYLVSATLEGCGTGEFMIAEHLRFDGWESGAFSGTWEIVPGSGRLELANISGSGAVPGDSAEEGTTQDVRTGHISCS